MSPGRLHGHPTGTSADTLITSAHCLPGSAHEPVRRQRKNRSTFAADGATGIPWVLGGLSLAATAAPIVGVFFK